MTTILDLPSPTPLNDSLGTLAVVILGLLFIAYAVGPWNWRYIRNRWAGVLIRLGRVDEKQIFGEGPIHVWWPFERLVRVPMFDLKVDIPLPNLTTAAPNPQNVDIAMQVVLRFENPIKVILSVPDREPIEEFEGFVQAAARSAVQDMTIDELAKKNAGDRLGQTIVAKVRRDPVLKRWGLTIVAIQIKDIDFSIAFRGAQDDVVRAEGSARATLIQAEAQKKAADLIGQGNVLGLFAMLISRDQDTQKEMAKAGGLRTLVQAGSNWMDKFFENMKL